jgi:hypothetical protein
MRFLMTPNLRLHITFPVLALLLGVTTAWLIGTRRGPTPLEVVRKDELLDAYDTNFWASLQKERPADWKACRDFCRLHPQGPNCATLAQQALFDLLRDDAARASDLPRDLTTKSKASSVHEESR